MTHPSNQARPPSGAQSVRSVSFDEIRDAMGRFCRRLSLPLVIAWLAASALLYALVVLQGRSLPSAVGLASFELHIQSVREFLVLLLVAQAISLLRTGLFLPARLIYDGEGLGARDVWKLAATRVPALISLTILSSAVFIAVGLACFLLGVAVSTWVILPLAFALEPAKYYTTAHQLTAGSALRRSLAIARRHWLPIFVIFGATTCISAALPFLAEATALTSGDSPSVVETIGRVSLHLGADFIGFIASCGLYFAIDELER